jgi:rRNA-processing protein FCF1
MAKATHYFVDTNFLLDFPRLVEDAPWLGGHIIVVPRVVLDELDRLRSPRGLSDVDEERARRARLARRTIDAVQVREQEDGGHRRLKVFFRNGADSSGAPDDVIAETAVQYRAMRRNRIDVVVVTSDVSLRIKARALGLGAVDPFDPPRQSTSRPAAEPAAPAALLPPLASQPTPIPPPRAAPVESSQPAIAPVSEPVTSTPGPKRPPGIHVEPDEAGRYRMVFDANQVMIQRGETSYALMTPGGQVLGRVRVLVARSYDEWDLPELITAVIVWVDLGPRSERVFAVVADAHQWPWVSAPYRRLTLAEKDAHFALGRWRTKATILERQVAPPPRQGTTVGAWSTFARLRLRIEVEPVAHVDKSNRWTIEMGDLDHEGQRVEIPVIGRDGRPAGWLWAKTQWAYAAWRRHICAVSIGLCVGETDSPIISVSSPLRDRFCLGPIPHLVAAEKRGRAHFVAGLWEIEVSAADCEAYSRPRLPNHVIGHDGIFTRLRIKVSAKELAPDQAPAREQAIRRAQAQASNRIVYGCLAAAGLAVASLCGCWWWSLVLSQAR